MIKQICTNCVSAGVERIAEKGSNGYWYGAQRMTLNPSSHTRRMSRTEMKFFILNTHGDDCECDDAEHERLRDTIAAIFQQARL